MFPRTLPGCKFVFESQSWRSKLELSILSTSFPTSSSVFSLESSLSSPGELIVSTAAGMVIPSNGELGRVELGVVEMDPNR